MDLQYKTALVNVFWNEGDENTRYFNSVSEQNSYFDILTTGKLTPLFNFNMGNNVETSIIYEDTIQRSPEELLRCNYCVIYKLNSNEEVIERRYFFAYPTQESGNQYRVILSLDDLQTNYFRYKTQISPCQIRRACLNRFVEDEQDATKVKFNGDVTSMLFERESQQEFSKRLTKRTKLNLKVSDTEAINDWYNENVYGWVYVYVQDRAYKLYSGEDNTLKDYNLLQPTYKVGSNGLLSTVLQVFAYPITHQNKGIYLWWDQAKTKNIKINENGYTNFKLQNNNNSYVYSVKFSIYPPAFFNDCYIENNQLYVNGYSQLGGAYGGTAVRGYQTSLSSGTFAFGLLYLNDSIKQDIPLIDYTCEKEFKFSKSDVILNDTSIIYNPKLLSNEFFELNLTNERGDKFTYDLQKVNSNVIKTKYSEAITPDITRSYFRITNLNGVYIDKCDENLTGLVSSFDNSLMVDNDQLSQMLAQNKNFYLQNVLNTGERVVGGAIGGMITGKSAYSIFGGVAEGVIGMINTTLTIDNMRNAPKDVRNANGNAYFNTMTSTPGLYIEEYEILPNEKSIINDYMTKYGYVVNRLDYIGDYDNIRKNFNYIECEVDNISAPISNIEKERLKERLKSVRFWNTDTINYEKNYERWLENE